MVRIIDYRVRQNTLGESFQVLIVQGIVLVQSKETGLYYATTKEASIPTTFDEATCKSLLGQTLEGTIHKVDCAPYEVVNQETGDVKELNFRYVFIPAKVEQNHNEEIVEPENELVH